MTRWLGDVIKTEIFSFRLNFYCDIVVIGHDRVIEQPEGDDWFDFGIKVILWFSNPHYSTFCQNSTFFSSSVALNLLVKLISLDDITMPLLLTVNTKPFICTTLYDGLIILK